MIELRPYSGLGAARYAWLDARYHFSFSSYRDPQRMGWGRLRVWNDDRIAASSGFDAHPHSDMEIITYVRTGAISHRDSLGNSGRTEAGDVQVMSAGTGITHAEYNLEAGETTLFQIWIEPTERGGAPSWGQRPFPREDRAGHFQILASGLPQDTDALPIRTDARVAGVSLAEGQSVRYDIDSGRMVYLVPAKGHIRINGMEARARDGIAVTDESFITLEAIEPSEVVLVDTV